MTQEKKELLLNVLKDGLPYGLQLQITDVNEFIFNGELRVLSKNWCRLNIADPIKRAKVKNRTIPLNYIYIKPYLRPMSSMTEEEIEILEDIRDYAHTNEDYATKLIDFYNSHHLDYRGLILEGLAIEAPERMYNY